MEIALAILLLGLVLLIAIAIYRTSSAPPAATKAPAQVWTESVEELTITWFEHQKTRLASVSEEQRSLLSYYDRAVDPDAQRSGLPWLPPMLDYGLDRRFVRDAMDRAPITLMVTLISTAEFPHRTFSIPHDSSIRVGHRRTFRVFRDNSGKLCDVKVLN